MAVGAVADYDVGRRTLTCLPCALGEDRLVISGAAGASAAARAEKLRSAQSERHRRIKEEQPVLGRLKLALANEPDAGLSWAKGAEGERKLGAALDDMLEHGILVLHDRRIPRSRANIDHIAVSSSGVWVIDAKRYKGLVTRVDKGGWFRTDFRLLIAGRDRTSLVQGVQRQVEHVRRALADRVDEEIPVLGALCFVDAEFRLFAKPFMLDDVLVTWGKALRERLVEPGDLDVERREALHRAIAQTFPKAV